MKSRLLIIITTMTVVMVIFVTTTYLFYQMGLCETSSRFYDGIPEVNNVWECLQFLSNSDPYFPHGEPTIDYDIQFTDLVFLEIILIAGSASGIFICVSRRKRK